MTRLLLTAASVFSVAGVMFAQTQQGGQSEVVFAQQLPPGAHAQFRADSFQQSVVFNGTGSQPIVAGTIRADGRMGMVNVTGKPFSATEVRKSTQTLGNGAKIEHSDSNLLYRDDMGRTRAEQTLGGKTVVVIMDPVAGSVYVLNSDNKTARKTSIPPNVQEGGVSVANGGVTMRWSSSTSSGSQSSADSRAFVAGLSKGADFSARTGTLSPRVTADHAVTEDLGLQMVNGVMAQGMRNTQVIPAQSIGNDRELQVVDEHWFSNDLQMLVKSVNSDPRFGETTYQLTNVLRGGQDPMLFQVPADYTVSGGDMKIELQAKPVVVK